MVWKNVEPEEKERERGVNPLKRYTLMKRKLRIFEDENYEHPSK